MVCGRWITCSYCYLKYFNIDEIAVSYCDDCMEQVNFFLCIPCLLEIYNPTECKFHEELWDKYAIWCDQCKTIIEKIIIIPMNSTSNFVLRPQYRPN